MHFDMRILIISQYYPPDVAGCMHAIGYMLTSMIAILVGVFAIFTTTTLHAISNYAKRVRK